MKILKCFICIMFVLSARVYSQQGSFMYGGVLRDYILHVPAMYNGSVAVPLVINLHGYTSNAAEQQLYTQFDVLADTANFIVVYPNGINNQWNSGWNYPYNSGTDDVGFLSALIDTLSAHYNIDSTHIHATGMSNGGFMSFRLACELSHRIASIASVTGLMSLGQVLNCNPARRVPVMFIHGTADATVLYNGSTYYISADSTFGYWKQKNNCTGTPVQYNFPDISTSDLSTAEKYTLDACSDSAEVVFIKVINGSHTWPGAYPLPNLVTNQDFKASTEIWNFFRNHPMPAQATGVVKTEDKPLLIYPNPVTDVLFVNAAQAGHYELYNTTGNLVQEAILEEGQNELMFGLLQQGVYLLFIRTTQMTVVRKITVL